MRGNARTRGSNAVMLVPFAVIKVHSTQDLGTDDDILDWAAYFSICVNRFRTSTAR